jgi:glycosyltransferase involved in cell wall biosynthesis
MTLDMDRDVLLFYAEADKFVPWDRVLKQLVRPLYRRVVGGKSVSGFFMWHTTLVNALRGCGYRVHVNQYRLARDNPTFPVGITGYPYILDQWKLPNPAVIGPGMFDHPGIRPHLMTDPRFRAYIVTCDWVRRMFEPFYGSTCAPWHGGIDATAWPDLRDRTKTVDFVVYDKIRWRRPHFEPALLAPVLDTLRRRGHTYTVLRYGKHSHADYRKALASARAMIFLCEHETQGLAYQEAMASNVPILAWDNGFWLDPMRESYTPDPVPASSVPYFSAECGQRFARIEDFPAALEELWSALGRYQPRAYVLRELTPAGSARLYVEHLRRAARDGAGQNRGRPARGGC